MNKHQWQEFYGLNDEDMNKLEIIIKLFSTENSKAKIISIDNLNK